MTAWTAAISTRIDPPALCRGLLSSIAKWFARQACGLPLLAAAVFLSPPGEFEQRRTQRPSIGCERVFGAKNGFVKNTPLDQSVSFKLP